MNYLSITTTFCLLLLASWCSAQEYYSIESFQDEYEVLEDYNSMALETQGYFFWKKEFNLDFEFPFYDTSYQNITCKHNSLCWFD